MTLAAGTRLGPYEILSPLGAGGMGEVYRARDTRLAREVAIKVLPDSLATDQERLKRFEKEARSASALNHPNIVTIHDIGSVAGVSYIAMELVDGATLRELLASGALPIKKLLQIAPQIAEGLARAHEAGIVHRDLKPENVMVKKDGLVKILDFGLAKLTSTGSGSGEGSQLPTMTGTQPGVVVGTVSYMSPEQASGQTVDFRSDQFSLGAMLYEMATGKRAFQKKTAIDTLAAILNEEPQPILSGPQTPTPLRWITERCLAKEPRQRYAATEDLARDLAGVRDHSSEMSGVAPAVAAKPALRRRVLTAVGAGCVLAAGYLLAMLRAHPAIVPRIELLTFQKGMVWSARFAPDGQTVVYSMFGVGSNSKRAELYSTRVGSLDSRPLGLPPADILSISRSGRMAILLEPADELQPSGNGGTLAEVSLSGGTPRAILENVLGADWSRETEELAVLHRVDGKYRLEYPAGRLLHESTNRLGGPVRVSPGGEWVAFAEHKPAKLSVALRLVDRKGVVYPLIEDLGQNGGSYGWSSRGDELWWFKSFGDAITEVHAVTVKGKDRVVMSLPGDFNMPDISGEGRMLVERIHESLEMVGFRPGESSKQDLAWLDHSFPAALSADGRVLLFGDRGSVSDTWEVSAYVRKMDGSPAVRLGKGYPLDLSPDGAWALVLRAKPDSRLVLLPTGAGQERPIASGLVIDGIWARFHPDGKRVIFLGSEPGHRPRLWEQRLESGAPTPVMPEGVGAGVLSPDGSQFAACDGSRRLMIFPTDPRSAVAPRAVAQLSANEDVLHWNSDGASMLIGGAPQDPLRIDRLDLASGRRVLWRSFSPGGLMGGGSVGGLAFSANEQAWVLGYARNFSELLVVDGLK